MSVDCINSWAKIKSEKQYLTITWSYSAAEKWHKLENESLIKLSLLGLLNILSQCFNSIRLVEKVIIIYIHTSSQVILTPSMTGWGGQEVRAHRGRQQHPSDVST